MDANAKSNKSRTKFEIELLQLGLMCQSRGDERITVISERSSPRTAALFATCMAYFYRGGGVTIPSEYWQERGCVGGSFGGEGMVVEGIITHPELNCVLKKNVCESFCIICIDRHQSPQILK